MISITYSRRGFVDRLAEHFGEISFVETWLGTPCRADQMKLNQIPSLLRNIYQGVRMQRLGNRLRHHSCGTGADAQNTLARAL